MTSYSSCNCATCDIQPNFVNPTLQTNCNFNNKYFSCKNRAYIGDKIEPTNQSGYEFINPEVISSAYAPEFYKVNCEDIGEVYTSQDPRLISIFHNGQVTPLDVPPTDHSIKLADIYTHPTMKNYGVRYKNYADIKAGQILYYNDKSIEDDLFQPNFANPARVTTTIYSDPMGGTYPEYLRTPVRGNNVMSTQGRRYTYGLSSIDDQNEFREDIMHLQMRPQDRTRYTTRWQNLPQT
jgi:hypothetical protein